MNASKSAIVTGAASGIGRASAELLAREGYRVTLCDLDEAGGRAAATAIEAAGGIAQFVRADVTNEPEVEGAVARALSAYGRLDAAINSAGVPQRGKPVHELSLEAWDFCNGINLRGMFLCMKHEVAAMLKGGGGAIVAVSSAAATKGLINSVEYSASKAGVTGLVRGAALDVVQQGIRINALLPGGTDTPLAQRSMEANPALADTVVIPIGRMASPAEIAAGAVWLVSDQSSYVTGACVAIDGGMGIV